jgi:hypothetical protein
VWEQQRALVVLNYAALSFAIVLAFWGTARIARRVETLRAATSNVLEVTPTEQFREMNSVVGPLLASAATAIAFGLSGLAGDAWTPAVLEGASWFLLGIPLWTFLWTYASLQLGLDRLGRKRLPPDAGRIDRTLTACSTRPTRSRTGQARFTSGRSTKAQSPA